MVLDEKQVSEIKSKLLGQLTNLPEESREQIKNQIEKMDAKQLEIFLNQNVKMDKCVFCSIVEGETESYKIYEDEEFVGVLNINPLSKGHSLLIPKEHDLIEEVVEKIKVVGEKISEILRKTFQGIEEINTKMEEGFGHKYLSILPIYGDEKGNNVVKPTDKEFLDTQKKIIGKFNEEKKIEKQEQESFIIKEEKSLPKANSRIP